MATGKFTAADLDAPQSGQQQGQFSAADIDQGGSSQPPPGLGQQVVDWLHSTFAPRSAADMPGTKTPTGEMPGSFEGHPENVGEYVPRTAGEVAGGVKDIVQGNVAKGSHRVISGAGEAIAPVTLPFVAAAAPAATAVALGTGAAGQVVGKEGAKALGASEDQSDLAGDITGIGAGYGASKLPVGRVAGVAGKVAKGTLEDIPGVRQVGKLAEYWKQTAPKEGTPLVSKEPLGPDAPDPDLLKARSLTTANTPAAAPASKTGEALGQIKRGSIAQAVNSPARTLPGQISPEIIQPPAAPTAQPIPPRQGLALPAAPAGAELSDLPTTAAKPASQTGEALGQVPQRGAIADAVKPEAKPITRGSLSQMLQEQLGQGLGASKLDPKMPLRQQLDSMPAKPSADIPEGHTPVQSSALRSYKYDPAAKEFHARYSSGDDTTHVFGDVDPEEAQAFDEAPSKGKAMQQIKQGHPLVAKIVNGKRLSVTSSAK